MEKKAKIKIGKWILIGGIIGFILIFPLFVGLRELDSIYCLPKLKEIQIDFKGIPLCEKENVLERYPDTFCKENKLYYLYKKEYCISRILYYPIKHTMEDFRPDTGIIIFFVLELYGIFIGIITGGIGRYFVYKFKNVKRK